MGSKVGIQLTDSGSVQLVIDGVKDDEVLPGGLLSNQPVYAFFDLYGQCQQVRNKEIYILAYFCTFIAEQIFNTLKMYN